MVNDIPTVKVWTKLTASTWGLVGDIAAYDDLTFTPTFLEEGTWEMTLPWTEVATPIEPDRLYTIDWRGVRTTWMLDQDNPKGDAQGLETLTVGGPAALSMLGWELAWPDPVQNLAGQPDPPKLYRDNTETVIRDLIGQNFVVRRGGTLDLGSNLNRGKDPTRARARFDNLLELVAKKAKYGGLGVDLGLVNITSTRATLQLLVWEPADKSDRVRLSQKVGNVGEWSQNNTAPEATEALVAGPGGYRRVTTPESEAAAALWGGHRVKYVPGATSYDPEDLQQAGEEALADGAATTNVSLRGTDAPGLQAFTHYNVGDRVTGELQTGLDVVDTITSIKVSVTDRYPDIEVTFGDPNADDPTLGMAQLMRNHNRRLRQVEQRS